MKLYRNFTGVLFLVFTLIFSNVTKVYAISIKEKGEIKHKYSILIDVSEFDLYLIDKDTNKVVKDYPIAGGKRTTHHPMVHGRLFQRLQIGEQVLERDGCS